MKLPRTNLRRTQTQTAADEYGARRPAGELDDQDGVLRRQADDGDQADLEEHVVASPRGGSTADAPSTPSGTTNITENGSTSSRTAPPGRGTPTAATANSTARRARTGAPARQAGPLVGEARRQLAARRFHPAIAAELTPGRRLAGDLHRGIAVVAHSCGAGDPARARRRPNGTICPACCARVPLRSRSSAACAPGASAWMTTRCTRPGVGEVVDVGGAQRGRQRAVVGPRPSAAAFSRSMSSCSCGASARPSGRTPVKHRACCASRATGCAPRAAPSWPCRRAVLQADRLKPVALPSSGIAGGAKAKTMASRMPPSLPMAAPRPPPPCSGARRSLQSFSVMKAMPAFWPRRRRSR